MNSIFRTLIVFSSCVYLLWFFIPFFENRWPEQITQEIYFLAGKGAIIPNISELAYVFLLLNIVIALGLFFFQPWARVMFITMLVVNGLIALASGLVVITSFDSLLEYLMNIIDGALVVMIYFTSVNTKFKNQAPMSRSRPL